MRKSKTTNTRLPALERNILKYRALEMIIILFEIENLKAFVLDSIQTTDKFDGRDRINTNSKDKYRKAWQILVEDKVITQNESKEIQELIDYRNNIGHRIHLLVGDLNQDKFSRDYSRLHGIKYDYAALDKLKKFSKKIEKGMHLYISTLSVDRLLFEAAQITYQKELENLRKKITRQFEKRKKGVKSLKQSGHK